MKKIVICLTIFLVPMLPDITLLGQVCVGMFTDYAYAERSITVKAKERGGYRSIVQCQIPRTHHWQQQL